MPVSAILFLYGHNVTVRAVSEPFSSVTGRAYDLGLKEGGSVAGNGEGDQLNIFFARRVVNPDPNNITSFIKRHFRSTAGCVDNVCHYLPRFLDRQIDNIFVFGKSLSPSQNLFIRINDVLSVLKKLVGAGTKRFDKCSLPGQGVDRKDFSVNFRSARVKVIDPLHVPRVCRFLHRIPVLFYCGNEQHFPPSLPVLGMVNDSEHADKCNTNRLSFQNYSISALTQVFPRLVRVQTTLLTTLLTTLSTGSG